MLPPTKTQSTKHIYHLFQPQTAEQIRINFQELTLFEQVKSQYQDLGVRFEGAITISPSNPAFFPLSGLLVVMPVADDLTITVHLHQPMQKIGALVIGSRQVRLIAFDRHSNVLAHQSMTFHPVQSSELVEVFPQQKLEITATDIARVVFSSDAPFVMSSLYCC
jgi:hypothetical protein